jgi:hypothetical protein
MPEEEGVMRKNLLKGQSHEKNIALRPENYINSDYSELAQLVFNFFIL